MQDLIKIVTILPKDQYFQCVKILTVMLVGSILEAIGIGAVLPLISVLGDSNILDQYPYIAEIAFVCGIESRTELVIAVSLLCIGLYFLKNVYIVWETKLQIRFAMQNQIDYARALLAEYLMKPYLFHVNHNTTTLIRNVDSGAAAVFSNILNLALQLFMEIITVLAIWVMLIMVDPFTAIVVAGVLALLLLCILRAFRRQIVSQGVVRNQFAAQYAKWLHQALGAIKETKVLQKEEFFLEEFRKAYTAFGEAQGRFSFLNQIPRNIIEFLVLSGLMLLVIGKTLAGENPQNVVSLLGVLALAAFRLMPSVYRIVSFVNSIKFQMPLFHEVYMELIAIRRRKNLHELIQIEVQASKMQFAREIAVRHLGFQYPETAKEVLKEADFVVPKGAYVGIVGASGAGKTTFVDILLGLLPPTVGSICVDEQDIQGNIRGWQKNLAYVPQSIYLIDASIKENIALGEPGATIDETKIEEVLRMAELYDFVQELPDGIDTMVGERGVKLSGGQRQRIGIARALYQDPEVLILDEATSALDNATEKSITGTILRLKGSMTIISIAHRVTTLADCDFKVEFQKGRAYII